MTLRHALLATTRALTLAISLSVSVHAQAQAVSVTDDRGHTVSLPRPAQRVISLAPHATELIFAAGGGERLVGVVEYSDYPEAAKTIRRVGDNKAVDLEAIAALKPELIVVWRHGNARRQLEKLGALGIPMYESDPRRLDDLPEALMRLGRLLGTEPAAQRAAADYRRTLQTLRERYAGRPPVTTFYQVWRQPLKTLNNDHMVSDVIRLCGGVNVFGTLEPLVPTLSDEAVLQANPEFIFTASMGATHSNRPVDSLDGWKRFPRLTAVQRGNLFYVNGDLINRPTPRVLEGAALICEAMEGVRGRR
ncbi:MAG: cobalamin-binding protein [Caldimonas sp.]|uniref:cobalamin-binding protein n=1 Tax=Caldimonas sp. TaxID=2838790 RepID=UPI003918F468